jgi:hypothetical protein
MRRFVALLFVALVLVTCATVPTPPVVGVPGPPGHVRYIIGGDSRDDSSHVLPWAFAEARARAASGFIFLGDMELTPQLDEHFRAALPALGSIPFYPALGNHEVRLFGIVSVEHEAAEAVFRRRFLGTPATPIESSLQGRVVYGVTLPGGVHLVALDNVSQAGFGQDQLAWLERDLASARRDPSVKYIIVGMHQALAKNGVTKHSMDADGPRAIADSDAALALFVKYRVSLLVASHLHAYLAYTTAGIPSYITGGLGAPLDGSTQRAPDYAFHHFLQVDVEDSGLHVSVVRFPGSSSVAEGKDKD